jgi:hypothetical protein
MRSIRLLAATILAVVLALSMTQNAFASTEIAYDDGGAEVGWGLDTGDMYAVLFSLPFAGSAKLLTVRAYVVGCDECGGWLVHVTDSAHVELAAPFMSPSPTNTPGWLEIPISGIVVPTDFYVVLEWLQTTGIGLGVDVDTPNTRSYLYTGGTWTLLDTDTPWTLMIRAYVDPYTPPAPVGGIVVPADMIAVLAQWLAVVGLIGCIGTVVVAAKKRHP